MEYSNLDFDSNIFLKTFKLKVNERCKNAFMFAFIFLITLILVSCSNKSLENITNATNVIENSSKNIISDDNKSISNDNGIVDGKDKSIVNSSIQNIKENIATNSYLNTSVGT